MKRWIRWTLWALGGLVALLLVALVAGFVWLRGSLPQLEGEAKAAAMWYTASTPRTARSTAA